MPKYFLTISSSRLTSEPTRKITNYSTEILNVAKNGFIKYFLSVIDSLVSDESRKVKIITKSWYDVMLQAIEIQMKIQVTIINLKK